MLFGKRKRVVNRILIVEDEPLTAFDNEVMLGDLGYEVVATLDSFEDAIERLDSDEIDLILSDSGCPGKRTGLDLARAAKSRGVPIVFSTGQSFPRNSVQLCTRLHHQTVQRANAEAGTRSGRQEAFGQRGQAAEGRGPVRSGRKLEDLVEPLVEGGDPVFQPADRHRLHHPGFDATLA